MITKYFVCYGPNTEELREAVNSAIKNGWQPLGGVAVAVTKWQCFEVGQYHTEVEEEREFLYQAVVKMTVDGS